MPCDTMDNWLVSGKPAVIGSYRLRPIEHTYVKGKPLSSQKGQAEAFFLTDEQGQGWILKKFRHGCHLDMTYLKEVTMLLPKERGFICGTRRQIVTQGVLKKARGIHYSRNLDRWLDGTILMPRVPGLDWACLADEIRAGEVTLKKGQRLGLCKRLTKLVELLEGQRCCHRDLSCGNVFVDVSRGEVYLIDFDSLYHPSLEMPNATTCGTEGYTASYIWTGNDRDPRRSWCKGADRFALTLLNVEILTLGTGATATGEGGIFDQEELTNRSGRGIDSVVTELRGHYPGAAELLLQAINSRKADDCPSPQAWDHLLHKTPVQTSTLPTLRDLPDLVRQFGDLLTRSRPTTPLWPAPSLAEVPIALPSVQAQRSVPPLDLELPPDPWAGHSDRVLRMIERPQS